ncbi:hypothetical protein DXB65_11810 [Bacteroides oleiciplenus]|uniref:Uncharacterized protein n=1 Tax=Bacteroides oleiciplenus TaxID=626931 RepID=A0A3E5BCL8_9BACE|nr:hypothetical protein DXB65_11810 [Bacteroides oleiciplenus]
MVSNHLENALSNPVRNNRAQKYLFSSEQTNVFSSFFVDFEILLLENEEDVRKRIYGVATN